MKNFITLWLLLGIMNGVCVQPNDKSVNILFISVDDLNDWTGFLSGYAGKVHTPNMDKLAAQGMNFTNAHCPSPVCNPSRTAILTGLMPSSTGIYRNDQWWKPNLPEVKTIPMAFKENGYYVAGAGKIFHHTAGFNPPDQWHDFQPQVFDDPWQHANYYPELPAAYPEWFPRNGLIEKGPLDWGGFEKDDYQMGDGYAVQYGIDFLQQAHGKPFFLAIGIYRPHLPWYMPEKYLEMYPLENIELPKIKKDDLKDIPPVGQEFAAYRRDDLELVRQHNKQKEAIQAYLASISYADQLIGDLLQSLEASDYAENTVVVLWSDHGWHHGEKEHLHKSTLWERATRVPFVMGGPGIPKARVNEAVNLVDIYPTLTELCGLETNQKLDGESLVPFFKNPEFEREKPAITTFGKGNHAVRDERYRYIKYSDGGEELYDHQHDPNEWNNLVGDENHQKIKESLGQWLPQEEKENVPRKGAFHFDAENYEWKLKK